MNHFNITEVARRMGKPRVWLSQRLNRCKVNGKPVDFTPEELDLLCTVLSEMWEEIVQELEARKKIEKSLVSY